MLFPKPVNIVDIICVLRKLFACFIEKLVDEYRPRDSKTVWCTWWTEQDPDYQGKSGAVK